MYRSVGICTFQYNITPLEWWSRQTKTIERRLLDHIVYFEPLSVMFSYRARGWWRWALVNLDGVVPSWMVGVSVSVNLPCTIKSRSFLLAPAHPGGPGKKSRKMVCVCVCEGVCVCVSSQVTLSIWQKWVEFVNHYGLLSVLSMAVCSELQIVHDWVRIWITNCIRDRVGRLVA